MIRQGNFMKAAIFLVAVWGCVWAVRSVAGSRKITAERVNREVIAAGFDDWSSGQQGEDAAKVEKRGQEIRKIAGLINRLDFQEREKNRGSRAAEGFFRKLSGGEKAMFIELTVVESMGRFMESLDAMKPEQRKKFVEQGLKEIRQGSAGSEMARVDGLGADLLEKISQEGMRAYFEKSSADTKLDLAPLMEAMNEAMQGLRGNEFGPRQ